MNPLKTFGNHVLIKLDQENDRVKLPSGVEFFVDTTYDPEKHTTVTGEVVSLPSTLYYGGVPNKGMPWKTQMEIKIGDRVVIYYLAVLNCFRKEMFKAIIEGDARYVFIQYQNIFALVREGTIIPINGYCLVEPIENPSWTVMKQRMAMAGLQAVRLEEKNNTEVVFGKIKYMGHPIEEYSDGGSDKGVCVKIGDTVIMRKISDIPLEYDLHAKIDGRKKYWRVQRRKIFAVI